MRRYARKNDLDFNVFESRGKGSHMTITLGERRSIVKSGELKPGYVALILKQLGLPREALD